MQEPSTTYSLVDLSAQLGSIEVEIKEAINRVLESSEFVLGSAVESFERSFADYCRTECCIGVSSGTAALHLALRALDIGPGDEVITTPHTFIATVWAISYVGAKPVFVDIDPDTFTIDPAQIESRITSRTRAIIPVHIYGQPADMGAILKIAERHEVAVIEDAAQAHGAEYEERRCGSIGAIGCFSFYPTKNLGAYGEAGAVVTNDRNIAERIRQLRDHAQSERYLHSELGYNYRMDALQGTVLNVKLRHLDEWISGRRGVARQYFEVLGGLETVEVPFEAEYSKHVYHVYGVQLRSEEARDDLALWLSRSGIATGRHYPIPVHLQPAYKELGYRPGDFPVAEKLAKQELSLPIYAELGNEDVQRIAESILRWTR